LIIGHLECPIANVSNVVLHHPCDHEVPEYQGANAWHHAPRPHITHHPKVHSLALPIEKRPFGFAAKRATAFDCLALDVRTINGAACPDWIGEKFSVGGGVVIGIVPNRNRNSPMAVLKGNVHGKSPLTRLLCRRVFNRAANSLYRLGVCHGLGLLARLDCRHRGAYSQSIAMARRSMK
jgi:hypothetical protein